MIPTGTIPECVPLGLSKIDNPTEKKPCTLPSGLWSQMNVGVKLLSDKNLAGFLT